MEKEKIKKWLDALAEHCKREKDLKELEPGSEFCICTKDYIHFYKCGKDVAEIMDIPYSEYVHEIEGERYTSYEFKYAGITFVSMNPIKGDV